MLCGPQARLLRFYKQVTAKIAAKQQMSATGEVWSAMVQCDRYTYVKSVDVIKHRIFLLYVVEISLV